MKKGQAAALIAGATLGLGGVALGVVLARKEGREAARRFLDQYGDLGQKSSQAALNIASQARKVGEQVARTAAEQYQAQMPKALDAWNTVKTQAPQVAGSVSSLARGGGGLNGKTTLGE